jgi:hypothetical protein
VRNKRYDTASDDVLSALEVLALLFPGTQGEHASPVHAVTALVLDPHLGLTLQTVTPDPRLLSRARVAGRCNHGTPIIDPQTREVIGYELSPLAVA